MTKPLKGRCTVLLALFNQHFRTRNSASLKDVAPIFGSDSAAEDPGGYTSTLKIEEARTTGGAEAQQWCLTYNKGDLAAESAIREGLLRNPPGRSAAPRFDAAAR